MPAESAERAPARKYRNRLAKETSPYLLMHADNPVDWYPWGDEAFTKARAEGKLIFLSIGYSSCYWCHVMERESFMDEEIAALLNKRFVPIKVDREERPDVDAIYMTAVQLTTGRGGWPLTVFLTPAGKPFFGGTYFPARDGDRSFPLGLLTILQQMDRMWREQPNRVKQAADVLTRSVEDQMRGRPSPAPVSLDDSLLSGVLERLARQYDPDYGGFGYSPANPSRPKFPEPSNLVFLIDRAKKRKDKQAERLLVGTLEQMAAGGIRDHLGGGFHRYSTDRYWRIPHFEKMLYDNGQLASVYTDAYLLTGREDFKRVAVEILDFVLREMTDAGGGFYSALDAESEGEEGKYYRWEKAEVAALLSKDEMALFAAVYGLNGPPNFDLRYYVPQLEKPLGEIAAERGVDEAELESRLAPIRKKLLAARKGRTPPRKDVKILTGWNGLMIRGLADAGRGLAAPRYVEAARRAAEFLLQNLRTPDGRLLRTFAGGRAKLNAYLDDYAFLVDGLISLYRATGQRQWLQEADALTAKQIELFWDTSGGGFFFTSKDHGGLIARGKEPADGVEPSGNSVSADNLVTLALELNKPEYLDRAEKTVQASAALLAQRSDTGSRLSAAPRMAVAVGALLDARANLDQ